MFIRDRKKIFSEAAEKDHTHAEYAAKGHTHIDYKNKADFTVITYPGVKLYGAGGGTTLTYPSGFNKDNCAVISIGFCPLSDSSGGGYRGNVVMYQSHKYLMFSELGKNNLYFRYVNISGTGSNNDEFVGTIRIVLMKL